MIVCHCFLFGGLMAHVAEFHVRVPSLEVLMSVLRFSCYEYEALKDFRA